MIAIDDNFKISENGGTGNATIFVSATDKNLFSTASTQIEVSSSVGNIKRYVTLNKKAAHGYMYTPVEWVSNENLNSDCWIDLGYVWNNNSRAQFKGAYGTSNGNEWFGERITNWNTNGPVDDNGDLRWMYNNSIQTMYWDVPSGKRVEKKNYTPSTPFELEIGNFYIKNLQTGSNLVTGSTYNVSRTNTVGLFSASGAKGVIDKIKFYYIKIYEGDTLIRDIIPVLDKDNIPCFFDKVGEQFYYYKVNGEPSTGLTAGNISYTSDYIEGDGSDYIDIGYIPVANTYIEMDNQTDSMLSCGAYDDQRYGLYWQRGDEASGGASGNWRYSNDAKQIFFTSLPSTRYTVKFGKQYYINGEQKGSFSGSWYGISQSITVFGLHRPSDVTERTGGKLYGLKIYEGNTLVREYIPYKQYGVVGLYEKINGIFYPSNSNTMTQGGNIQPLVEKVVYTESDITINNDTPSTAINAGNTFNLNASTTPTGATLSYSSSDTSIATVDSNGVITAVGKGNATITITAQGFDDDVNKVHYNTTSKTVSVECVYPTQQIVITNSTPSEAINPNDTFDLNASTTPTGITLTYSSSDTSVATVNSNGVITGVATGTTTITITAQGFDDDVNKVHYNTTSKTVSVDISEAVQPSSDPLTDSGYFVVKFIKKINPSEEDNSLIVAKAGSPGSLSYCQNGIWTEINGRTVINFQNVGEHISFKGNITYARYNYYKFSTKNAEIEIGGCLMALNKNAEINNTNNTIGNASFRDLFNSCSGLTSAEHLKMADDCYENCYAQMFGNCKSLTVAPQLPSKTLAKGCYANMFVGCTSLTTAPSLPAKTLAESCYERMFVGCTSLTTAPSLPAKTVADRCYYNMFQNCTSLTSLTVGFASINDATDPIKNLLKNVTTDGILYCPSDADYSADDIGLPSTWTLSKTL